MMPVAWHGHYTLSQNRISVCITEVTYTWQTQGPALESFLRYAV